MLFFEHHTRPVLCCVPTDTFTHFMSMSDGGDEARDDEDARRARRVPSASSMHIQDVDTV